MLKTTDLTVECDEKPKPPSLRTASVSFKLGIQTQAVKLAGNFLEQFLIDIKISVHVLHVVVLFESFQ